MYLHVIRLTLETASPLSIGSGRVVSRKPASAGSEEPEEHPADAIVRDANGLPTIPGTSYQGVLKRLAKKEWSISEAERVFGTEGDRPEDGWSGTVDCGWGLVHDKSDNAIDPRPGLVDFEADAVLTWLKQDAPLWRDHVALSDRLAVEGRKKFARAAVPRGARFSLELTRRGPKDDKTLLEVAALFRHPDFRLGSARNRGYGQLTVVRASRICVPFEDPLGLRRLRDQLPSVPLADDLLPDPAFKQPAGDATVLRAELTAEDFLRFGASTEETSSLTEGTHGARALIDGSDPKWWEEDARGAQGEERPSDREASNVLRLLTEPVISYAPLDSGGSAEVLTAQTVQECGDWSKLAQLSFPVPGSQLRQPVAHRTLFHWNRARKRFVDADVYTRGDEAVRGEQRQLLREYSRRPEELGRLFGAAKGPPIDGAASPGRAGRLLVDDTSVAAEWVMALDHASIDRFTGSVRDRTGALFAEEVLHRARLTVSFRISTGPEASPNAIQGWRQDVCDAFLRALKDLCTGRLALGARSLGTCTGIVSIEGPSSEAWKARALAGGVPVKNGEALTR